MPGQSTRGKVLVASEWVALLTTLMVSFYTVLRGRDIQTWVLFAALVFVLLIHLERVSRPNVFPTAFAFLSLTGLFVCAVSAVLMAFR